MIKLLCSLASIQSFVRIETFTPNLNHNQNKNVKMKNCSRLCIFKIHFIFAELFQFTCPKVDESVGVSHPRYADPEDCQYFYVCINGVQPRRNGCKLGQAFNDVSKRCDWARKIPEW